MLGPKPTNATPVQPRKGPVWGGVGGWEGQGAENGGAGGGQNREGGVGKTVVVGRGWGPRIEPQKAKCWTKLAGNGPFGAFRPENGIPGKAGAIRTGFGA